MAKKIEEIVIVEPNDIVVSDSLLSVIPYSFNTDRVTRANCRICQSEHRQYVEETYECQPKKNYTAIRNKLKDVHNFEISLNAIRNHLLYHYVASNDKESFQEYAGELQQWMDMQTNKVVSLKSRIALLEKEMFTIAQKSQDLDIIERRKSAETIKKLAEVLLTYESKLAEYGEEVKPVKLVFNQLKVIVNDEMEQLQSVTTKKTLSRVLSKLKDSVGHMIIE